MPVVLLASDDFFAAPNNSGTQKYNATGSMTSKNPDLAGLRVNSLIATRFSFPTFTIFSPGRAATTNAAAHGLPY
jgi:hypothetical protein